MGKSIKGKELGKGITEDPGTWLLAADNGFVLSCDGRYTVYRDDEDGCIAMG